MNRIIAVQVRGRPPTGGVIYYSPGTGLIGPNYLWQYEVWRCENDVATQFWVPVAGYVPTYMFYSPTNLTNYCILQPGYGQGTDNVIYAWTEANTPSQVATVPFTIVSAAEWAGAIYLGGRGGSYGSPSKVYRFNTATLAIDEVLSYTAAQSSFSDGGMGVTDGYLYYCNGCYLHVTSDGTAWSQQFAPDATGPSWFFDVLTNSDESAIYLAGAYADAGRGLPGVWELAGGNLTQEYLGLNTNPYFSGPGFAALSWLDSANVSGGPYAMEREGPWNDYAPDLGPQWAGNIGGTWTHQGYIATTISRTDAASGQGMIGMGGALYALVGGWDGTGEGYGNSFVNLAKLSGGAWVIVQAHAGFNMGYNGWKTRAAMMLSGTSQLCHKL